MKPSYGVVSFILLAKRHVERSSFRCSYERSHIGSHGVAKENIPSFEIRGIEVCVLWKAAKSVEEVDVQFCPVKRLTMGVRDE